MQGWIAPEPHQVARGTGKAFVLGEVGAATSTVLHRMKMRFDKNDWSCRKDGKAISSGRWEGGGGVHYKHLII